MNDLTLPALPCLCGNLRRSARALTQIYEADLRPLGLHSSQLTILQTLSHAGELTQRQLGQILAMDSTSLTRTLAIMSRERWIAERRGEDRRERRISLAPAGKKQLAKTLPVWNKVQSRMRRKLGPEAWSSLMQLTHTLTQLAALEGDSQ